MQTRTLALIIILGAIIAVSGGAFLYTAPSTNRPQEIVYPITVVDDLGRNVTVPGQPLRIVSLVPSATQIVFEIGAGDRVVGVTRYDDYPPELVSLVKNGTIANVGGGLDPDIETIIQLKPDLILVDGPGEVSPQALQELQQLGYITLALNANSVKGVLHDIQLMGVILGYQSNAGKVVANIDATVSYVQGVVKDASRPTVFIENWNDPLITAGNRTLQNEMVEIAGGINIFSDLRGYEVSSEAVIAGNPDIIISFDSFETVNQIMARPGWENINAVRDGNVYQMNPEDGAPNPRIGENILSMAKLLHPGLFSSQTITGEIAPITVLVARTSGRRS